MDSSISINSIKRIENSAIESNSSTISGTSVENTIDREAKLKELGQEFEKIFIKYLVDSMYKSVDIFSTDDNFERAIWHDFLNSELASKISESCNLGISEAICSQSISWQSNLNDENNADTEIEKYDDKSLVNENQNIE